MTSTFLVFSYVLNNAQVTRWPERRPKLVIFDIAVFCVTVY